MALLGSKKPVPEMAPDLAAGAPAAPAPPSAAAPKPAPKPPAQISLVMSVDGGLNGQCWRAGTTVVLDPEAADFYLSKGYATRAP